MTATAPPIASSATRSLLLIASVIGAGTFIYGVTLGDAIRAWQILLVNFLFFAGLAQAGIVLSALFHATSAIWARPLKRVAEATAAFFPVSFVLLLILFLGLPTWASPSSFCCGPIRSNSWKRSKFAPPSSGHERGWSPLKWRPGSRSSKS